MTSEPALVAGLRQRLIDLALLHPKTEVCALLGGREHRLASIYPVANIADEPATEFLMDPREQVEAMRQMREHGETLRGIFHSHPDAPARPSQRDNEQAAYPDVYYLIASLQNSPPEIGIFYFDGDNFIEIFLPGFSSPLRGEG